jgi:uncharacterized membrane protein
MADSNPNSRLEALSDGVFAIAMTLLVIEIRVPSSYVFAAASSLWLALRDLLPSIFAFLLSFATIFITWVNHRATLKLVDKTTSPFIYANGFLLLAVVLVPFAAALLGEYLPTDHAAPAVVLYTAVDVLLATGWLLVTRAALHPSLLTKDEMSTLAMRDGHKNAYFALAIYTACAVLAFWFPLPIALLITVVWIYWLFIGVGMRSD